MRETIASHALKNPDNLEVAFETFHSMDIIRELAREKFMISLKERLKKDLVESYKELSQDWLFEDKSETFQINLDIENPSWENKFRIGIRYDNYDFLYFSVARINASENICKEIHTQFKNELKEGNDWANHWWTRSKDPYNRWEINIEGLKQIGFSDGIALNYFSNRINEFVCVIEKIRSSMLS